MKDIILANVENLRLIQKVKDLTDDLITKDHEIALKDSRIRYLEETVTELKYRIESESLLTDEIRLKANLYDKIKDVISEEMNYY